MRWAGHVARIVTGEAYIGYWWENLEGKRPLRSPRYRWKDDIKMNLQDVGSGVMDWIELVQIGKVGGHL